MYKKIYLISQEDEKSLESIVGYIKEKYCNNIEITALEQVFDASEDNQDLFLLNLSDNAIKIFFKNHLNKSLAIAIIPNDDCPHAMSNYGISKDKNSAIDDAFNPELLSQIDLLKCNDNIAFNRIFIGDMHGMNGLDYNKNSRLAKIKLFFENLRSISFQSYSITTSKDHTLQTAASGITILEHITVMNKDSPIREEISIHDGKLNAYVLAPTSLISYLWYLLSIFVYQRISSASLPQGLGLIKTEMLTISSTNSIDYFVDNGELCNADVISIEVLQGCLNIHLGSVLSYVVKNDNKHIQEKDVVKVNTLPKGELKNILIDGKLPLFKKASDDDFKELLVSLRDSAKFSYTFLTLMVLSTLLATTGLFANSAPVIIGAMILAPLMAPIISLSMGVIRADKFLLTQSIKTLAIGICMALLFSCIYTFVMPLEEITAEMQGRLNPNLLDLIVAVLSGIAGAYANAKEDIAKSLAGVAIAVALVPPLSVTGIGLGLGNIEVIYGSFLLFITNLVGITLSAALTFIVLGFAPVIKAKKGVFYTTILMSIIAIPLFLSFMQVVERHKYYTQLTSINRIVLNNDKIELKIQSIQSRQDSIRVSMEVISSKPLSLDDYKIIKDNLQQKVDKKLSLNIIPEILIE